MKIDYKKSQDYTGYTISQTIRAENEIEKQLLKDCLTNYSKKQKSILKNREIYSAGLTSISILRNIDKNPRILYRNTFYII